MTKIQNACKGHSMIEVLIALLVLSIGLLGLAGLQASSLQFTHDAQIRTTTSILAYDIMERIHTNKDNIELYKGGASCAASDCCVAATMSENNDLMCWTKNIQDQLPSGTGAVTGPDANGYYTVTITWLIRESGETATQSWIFLP